MYIKQLTIHGFKSYRDQVIVGPFSPGLNVVVGRNGSGKSNFFAAIRFVLNDAYSKLGQEERQALLHEGGGANQIAAYVEIIFDNGDGRFPTGRDEVVIRRTVGLKKDEYSLDKKPVTKNDVMNLLQSAGFSKSNPYYIVPQGRITALTNAKDHERLQLLKEVAGTRVYEEHREESLKIMNETEMKKQKITELLKSIEERLLELDGEKEELAEFLALDRERKAAEFLIYNAEVEKANSALAQLEQDFKTVVESVGASAEADEAQLSRIGKMETELASLRRTIDEHRGDLEAISADIEGLEQRKLRLELTISDLNEDGSRFKDEEERIGSILAEVEDEIQGKEEEIGKISPQVTSLESREAELRLALTRTSQERQALMSKRSRLGQFRTESDRNKWITKELEGLQSGLQLDSAQKSNLLEELESFGLREADLKEAISASEANDPISRLQALDLAYQEARRTRDGATETRKELWRAQAKLESSIAGIDAECEGMRRDASGSASDRAALQAIETVKGIAERLSLSHACHGPLHSLFSLADPVFSLATDVIAGSSLFHVVVDDDQVASRLLEALQHENSRAGSSGGGRVTFMPLNRLSNRMDVDTPDYGSDAVALLSRLQYKPKYGPAMQHVFGKAVVCKDLATAAHLSRQHGVDGITLSGDRVSRKGALTGGSSKQDKRNRLESLWRLDQWNAKRQEHSEMLQQVKLRILEADQQVTKALGQMQHIECQREEARLGKTDGSLGLLKTELASLQTIIAGKKSTMSKLDEAIRGAEGKIAGLRDELASPFTTGGLSSEEQVRLATLSSSFESLTRELTAVNGELSQALGVLSGLESSLEGNLRRKRQALLGQLAQASTAHLAKSIQLQRSELATVQDRLDSLRTDQERIGKALAALLKEETALSGALESARSLMEGNNNSSSGNSVSDHRQEMTRYLAKRRMLQQSRHEATEKVRDLGLVPEEALQALRGKPGLLARLHSAKDRLRKFGPVNRKALEQHSSFTRQSESLQTRLEELVASARAIDDFIRVLDSRKDEAILRTYQQVSEAFSLLFSRLVPTGHASLQMIRSSHPNSSGQVEFTGISMRASFNSKDSDEGLLLQQLSGGQKSLVSLALILAIQQTDPAPFYLFDEVDAALDSAHRTALAALLASLSTTIPDASSTGGAIQFVCTTFRPELVQRADKFFGVSFGSRVSRVEEISQEQALDFVETEAKI